MWKLQVLAGAAVLAACQPAAEEEPGNAQDPADSPIVNLPVPLPSPALDRAAILRAVAEAASAQVAGADDTAAQRQLDGRLFEFRIRFGCRGPRQELGDAGLGWSRDAEEGTLRIRVTPTITGDTDLVQQVAPPAVEEVEGFWVPRPWLLTAACPAAAAVGAPQEQTDASTAETPAATGNARGADPRAPVRREAAGAPGGAAQARAGGEDVQEGIAPPPPTYPRVGIVQFFTASDPRTGRRSNRPYEAVKTIPPEQLVGAQGFSLVLSGRLRALPGQGVIHCVSRGPDAPPDCIVSVHIDRVWIEQPGQRTPLAEWGSG